MIEFTGEIHPIANLFPMLAADELQDLADDIALNGQHHPIVLDEAGCLLDGRNRLAACTLVGVEPTFVTIAPADIQRFIVSENIKRRHLSKGQCAMLIARSQNCATQRHGDQRELARDSDISTTLMSRAFTVLEFSTELADKVIAGGRLDDAYNYVLSVRRGKEADYEHARELQAELNRTRAAAKRREKDAQEHVASLQLLIESIGEGVEIPKAPDLRLQTAPAAQQEVKADEQRDHGMYREGDAVRTLIKARDMLALLAHTPPALDGAMPQLMTNAVRDAVSQIVAAAYEVARRYNQAAQEQSSLRVVNK